MNYKNADYLIKITWGGGEKKVWNNYILFEPQLKIYVLIKKRTYLDRTTPVSMLKSDFGSK